MRWPLTVLVLVAAVLALVLLGVQVWVGERQLAAQKAEIARQEAAVARQKAELEAWQARVKAQPGQPFLPPLVFQPTPTVYQPPPFFPWFLWLFPVLMAPAWIAIAAEQQRLRKLQQHEEEDQTPYSAEELMENWEFKIVRCGPPLFDDPAFLQSILHQEACAGWQLVEKLDGTRVRLKRVAGQQPAAGLPAGYDPYRTAVGPRGQFKAHVALWLFCIACLVMLPLFILMQVKDPISAPAFWSLIAAPSGGAIVLGFFAIRQTARYRRLARPAGPDAGATRGR
jgi:hypothetical protein